jgi:hypothetical protein
MTPWGLANQSPGMRSRGVAVSEPMEKSLFWVISKECWDRRVVERKVVLLRDQKEK